jgi:Fe-S-cluster-containing dehydrogenase component
MKIVAGGSLIVAGAKPCHAFGPREPKQVPEEAIGILYDSTICIGCRACSAACKERNGIEADTTHDGALPAGGVSAGAALGIWDDAEDLSDKNYTVILDYDRGDGAYGFVKKQCMHCVDPACMSACPVSAFTKDPDTGTVVYNKDACIGCRYCFVACPFVVPRFEWDKAFPQVRKCELCKTTYTGIDAYAACCQTCPTGAALFGPREKLLEEAHKRLALQPGDIHEYPVGHIDGDHTTFKRVEKAYTQHVYGEKELGGTQVLILGNVPFEKLGLPTVGEVANSAISEGLQHTLYKGMIAPLVLFGGLLAAAYRSNKE